MECFSGTEGCWVQRCKALLWGREQQVHAQPSTLRSVVLIPCHQLEIKYRRTVVLGMLTDRHRQVEGRNLMKDCDPGENIVNFSVRFS